jgi:hypothetical protein
VRKVRRDEIVDYVTYEEIREELRKRVLAEKSVRRIHLGEHIVLLFETTETIRYQIQEMIRIEKIVREADIQHEIDTYNEILGGPVELGATMMIEIDDPAVRDRKLREWLELPSAIYAELDDGSRVRAEFDPRQVGDDRVSSVQFLKLRVRRAPVAIGVDHPALDVRVALTAEQRSALARDLEPA